MKAQHGPHPPAPSPSSRGGEKDNKQKEAKYRALATKAMIKIARDLRQRQTDAEVILWEALRNRRLANRKFRRQHPNANTAFVADFLCYECRFVIEKDGEIHNNLEDVLVRIIAVCEKTPLSLRDAQGAGVMPTKSSNAAPAQGRG